MIAEYLKQNGIELFSALDFSDITVTDPKKLRREVDFTPKSIIMLAVPYFTGDDRSRNISLYAVPKDYHLYFKELYQRLCSKFKEHYPENHIKCYADSSPIDERGAAVISGLGVMGKNSLVITERYGSYVFLGEIITDIDKEALGIPYGKHQLSYCVKCMRCINICPMPKIGSCLSELTQKKGELSPREMRYFIEYKTAWGCDLCQTVCPMNRGKELSDIKFFNDDKIYHLTSESVENMSLDEFGCRAYSWRKKDTILRNLRFIEQNKIKR